MRGKKKSPPPIRDEHGQTFVQAHQRWIEAKERANASTRQEARVELDAAAAALKSHPAVEAARKKAAGAEWRRRDDAKRLPHSNG